MKRAELEEGYRTIQASLASALSSIDSTARLTLQPWERPAGGGGETQILVGDGPIERAAINFSAVWGEIPTTMTERLDGRRFYATGISTIVHPRAPHAPTFHANLRYFETDTTAWFGGGADLTPYYLFSEDAHHFHRVLREACERHAVADYRAWKEECDRYFYLPHRGEARGIGGVFFDRLEPRGSEVWAFQMDLGGSLVEAYLPIAERRMGLAYDEPQTYWHELRRGRYVEFNLVWDRGTRFGLDTGGRTESVLASLPPRARWDEAFEPEPGSAEADLLDVLRGDPRPW